MDGARNLRAVARRTALVVMLGLVTAFAGVVFPFTGPLRAIFQRTRGGHPPAARVIGIEQRRQTGSAPHAGQQAWSRCDVSTRSFDPVASITTITE